MAAVSKLTIEVSVQELLSAIWYGDGSGHGRGVELTEPPDGYRLSMIELRRSEQLVRLHLEAAADG